jgi:aspartyl-tRNA(Asn)/glutamyl-tRNA(Gln) amidotransferase subunit A
MFHTIAEATAAFRDGTISAASLVEDSLAAIQRDSPRTNAFVVVDHAGARQRAADLDRQRSRGEPLGPLAGIPLSIKDLIDVAGAVTSAGSRVIADRVAVATAPVVQRLADAGAIIVGRTNLHEFALGTTSEDSAFGPVRHPVDASRSAGGSSGGSAVAVATGMTLGSIGTDTGGSVRIPAAICGLVGLKPSFDDVPTSGVVPLSPSFDHVGPLARSVEDAHLLYNVMSGRPATALTPQTSRTLRLRRLEGYFSAPLEAVVRDAFEQALEGLQTAGAHVDRHEFMDTHDIADTYVRVMLPEAAAWHASYLDAKRDLYTRAVGERLAFGRTILAVDYVAARERCLALRAVVDAALEDVDALVLPTLPIVAPVRGTDHVTFDDGRQEPLRPVMLKHTQLFNMTGHPAISLPVHSAGLAVGVQLVGRRGETAALLAAAAGCERALHSAPGAR